MKLFLTLYFQKEKRLQKTGKNFKPVLNIRASRLKHGAVAPYTINGDSK